MNLKQTVRQFTYNYDIEEVTVIDGYQVHYSGAYEKFFASCDVSMILERNRLLKCKVAGTCLLANRKLFIFLKQEGEIQNEN